MRLEDVVRSLPRHVLVAIDKDMVIRFFEGDASITGVSRDDAVGRHVDDVFCGVPEEARHAQRVLENGVAVRDAFSVVDTGRVRWQLLTNSFPVTSETGEVLGAGVILRDIGPFLLARERLAEIERLQAIGQMAAAVAHEVRNPLTAVRGFMQLARREGRVDLLEAAECELDRAVALLNGLMAMARPAETEEPVAPHDPAQLVREVAGLFHLTCRQRGIELSLCLDQAPPVLCQRSQVRQALYNLVQNAVQAMPDGGRLELICRADGEGTVMSVSDTGPGIPEEYLRVIGTPFFTTKADGTGLGVFTVKRIVAAHGGTLEIHSHPGRGSEFVLRFPSRPPNCSERPAPPPAAGSEG